MNEVPAHEEIIGYKKCHGNLIAKLQILGKNNQDRKSVVDKKYAQMRCSRAKVLQIYDMITREPHDKAMSQYDQNFIYLIGPEYHVWDYDDNLEAICTNGIHYYLTEEAAFMHDSYNLQYQHIQKNKWTGEFKMWYPSGQIKTLVTYVNGIRDGNCLSWHDNRQLSGRGSVI